MFESLKLEFKKLVNNGFIDFIINDIKENKIFHLCLLAIFGIVYLYIFRYSLSHDDVIYFYTKPNLIDHIISRLKTEGRVFYPIVIALINKLYLSTKVVYLLGLILFYINNFVLIKLFFPQMKKTNYLLLSLLLLVNPFAFKLLSWLTMFLSVQIGLSILFFSYYLFVNSNISNISKIILSSFAIFCGMEIMPIVFNIYITILFLSTFYKFILKTNSNFVDFIYENYKHIVYIILGLAIYYCFNKLLLAFFNVEQNFSGWRGQYLPIDSFNTLISRLKHSFFILKNSYVLYFFAILIINSFFLIFNLIKRKNIFLSLIAYICVFILLFLPLASDILININGTSIRFSSISYLFIIFIIIAISLISQSLLNKVLCFTVFIYLLISISLIDRISKVNENFYRVQKNIYDTINLKSFEFANNKKIYIYGANNSIFTNPDSKSYKRLTNFFLYSPNIRAWGSTGWNIESFTNDIGYYNIIYLYNGDMKEDLKNIIDNKIEKNIIFPKEGSIFEYNGNTYVIFSKSNK